MQKRILAAMAAGAMLVSTGVFAADEGDWMVRARAVHVSWVEGDSSAVPALGVPEGGIHLAHKTIPEVDISYFFTKNIAAELILTYPQKHGVHVTESVAGAFDAGFFKELPPSLTVQYHFSPDATLRPYVGAGLNYTRFSSIDLSSLDAKSGGVNTLSKSSTGAVLQAGFDYKLGANTYLNVDLKKVYIEADLTNSVLGKLSTIKGDPLLIGVGIGMKF